jgi:hypothetical protein
MASHSELTKKQAQDAYGRFTSSSSQQVQHRTTPPSQDVRRTVAPPSHRQEVGSSSCHTTSPPLHMQQVGSTSRRTTPPLRILEVHSLRVVLAPSSSSDEDSALDMWYANPRRCGPDQETILIESSSKDDCCHHVEKVSPYVQMFSIIITSLNSL